MIGVPTRRMKSAKSSVMLVAGKRMQPARHSFCQHKNHSDKPVLSCFLQCRRAKRNANTDEECKESKNGVPFLLLAEKRQDGEYPSCRSKKNQNENPLANQAINASLMAKENTEMLSYPLRGCKSNQPRRGIGKDRTVCLFCARVVRFRSSFVQLSLLPCAKSLPVPGKPLSPRGMI